MFPSWLELLLLIMLAGGFVGIILLIRSRRARSSDAGDMPVCGNCGYCVRGVPTLICPECGSDLREAGIHTQHMRRPLGPLAWIVIWSMCLPLPAVLLTNLCRSIVGPTEWSRTLNRVIFCQAEDLSCTVRAEMEGRRLVWSRSQPVVPLETMTLTFEHRTNAPVMTVDPATGDCEYLDAKGVKVKVPEGFGVEALSGWIGSAGIDTTPDAVQKKIADLLKAIDEAPIAQGKFTRLAPDPDTGHTYITAHPSHDWTRPQSVPFVRYAGSVFWLIVWLTGIVLIVRHHRKRGRGSGEVA